MVHKGRWRTSSAALDIALSTCKTWWVPRRHALGVAGSLRKRTWYAHPRSRRPSAMHPWLPSRLTMLQAMQVNDRVSKPCNHNSECCPLRHKCNNFMPNSHNHNKCKACRSRPSTSAPSAIWRDWHTPSCLFIPRCMLMCPASAPSVSKGMGATTIQTICTGILCWGTSSKSKKRFPLLKQASSKDSKPTQDPLIERTFKRRIRH